MQGLLTILVVFLIFIIINEWCCLKVYGTPLNKLECDILENQIDNYRRIPGTKILTNGNDRFISTVGSFFFTNYVNNVGLVWKYSKTSKMINKKRREFN